MRAQLENGGKDEELAKAKHKREWKGWINGDGVKAGGGGGNDEGKAK